MEGDAEALVNHIHPNEKTRYGPRGSDNDVLETLLVHFVRRPKYVKNSRYDLHHNQNRTPNTHGRKKLKSISHMWQTMLSRI